MRYLIDEVAEQRERAELAEQENKQLREAIEGKWAKYGPEGFIVEPGWMLIDGGRYDELEAAEQDNVLLEASLKAEREAREAAERRAFENEQGWARAIREIGKRAETAERERDAWHVMYTQRSLAAERELAELRDDAVDTVEHWASYAGDYFREKWDIEGDLRRLRGNAK